MHKNDSKLPVPTALKVSEPQVNRDSSFLFTDRFFFHIPLIVFCLKTTFDSKSCENGIMLFQMHVYFWKKRSPLAVASAIIAIFSSICLLFSDLCIRPSQIKACPSLSIFRIYIPYHWSAILLCSYFDVCVENREKSFSPVHKFVMKYKNICALQWFWYFSKTSIMIHLWSCKFNFTNWKVCTKNL